MTVTPGSHMNTLIGVLDRLSAACGRALAWLTPLMVLLTCLVVLLRYLFDTGAIWLQETVMYLHASVFLLGIAWTLQRDGHVRVDILHARLSARARNTIDLLGTLLFLIPVALFVLIWTWPYAVKSWQLLEGSPEVGGIPAVFLLKSLLPLSALLLLLQGVAEALRNIMALRAPPDAPG